MKAITEIERRIKNNKTFITWKYGNRKCEFVSDLPLTAGECENFVNGIDPYDMPEFYTGYPCITVSDLLTDY